MSLFISLKFKSEKYPKFIYKSNSNITIYNMTQQVGKLYKSVIDDVVSSVREAFADEGIDEQVLLDLKATWEKRLSESKAIGEASSQGNSNSGASGSSSNNSGSGGGGGGGTGNTNASSSSSSTGTHSNHNNNNNVSSTSASSSILPVTNNLPGPIVNAARVATITPSLVPGAIVTGNSITSTPVATIQPPQSSSASVSQPSGKYIVQLDGPVDTDDDEDDDDDDMPDENDHDDNDDDGAGDEDGENLGEDEEPLNSGDDVSDEEPNELFETDNVVVCQYDKITRSRNKWKFHLKDGIMNLQGRDYVFQKAVGDAEW